MTRRSCIILEKEKEKVIDEWSEEGKDLKETL
jgi:hypothetical protein